MIAAALLACLLLMCAVVRNHKKKQDVGPRGLTLRTSFANPLYDDSGADRTDLDAVASGDDRRMLANPTYVELLAPMPGKIINNPAFSGLPKDDWPQPLKGSSYLDISPFPSNGSGYLDPSHDAPPDKPRSPTGTSSRGADYLDVRPGPFAYNAAFTGPTAGSKPFCTKPFCTKPVTTLDLEQFVMLHTGSSYTDEPVYACIDTTVDTDATGGGGEPACTRMLGARNVVDVVQHRSDSARTAPMPIQAWQSEASSSTSCRHPKTTVTTTAGSSNPRSVTAGGSGYAGVDVELPTSSTHDRHACSAHGMVRYDAASWSGDPTYATLTAVGAEPTTIDGQVASNTIAHDAASSDGVRNTVTPDFEQAHERRSVSRQPAVCQSATRSVDESVDALAPAHHTSPGASPGVSGDLDIDDVLAYLDDATGDITVTDHVQAASQPHECDAAATTANGQAGVVVVLDHQIRTDPTPRPEPEQDLVINAASSASRVGELPEVFNIDGCADDLGGFEV